MVAIYLDSGDVSEMMKWTHVSGFTTNPSLARKAGIKNYQEFAQAAIAAASGKPLSLEVLADDLYTMEQQARIIASWGDNVYVKIPVTSTSGATTGYLVNKLAVDGVKINVTAVLTLDQIRHIARYLYAGTPAILSIFAGRIADTGRDPIPFITEALRSKYDKTKVLWASTRELYNLTQAEKCGCDIITVSPELLAKRHLIGKDLAQYSLDTVRQFYEDAKGIML